MKGTDCTPEQLEAAGTFILSRRVGPVSYLDPEDDSIITIRWSELVRLLAWYGALRFKAGSDGTGGTLEQPGLLVETNKHG